MTKEEIAKMNKEEIIKRIQAYADEDIDSAIYRGADAIELGKLNVAS